MRLHKKSFLIRGTITENQTSFCWLDTLDLMVGLGAGVNWNKVSTLLREDTSPANVIFVPSNWAGLSCLGGVGEGDVICFRIFLLDCRLRPLSIETSDTPGSCRVFALRFLYLLNSMCVLNPAISQRASVPATAAYHPIPSVKPKINN